MIIGIDIGHNVSYDTGAKGIRFEDELNSLVGKELIKKLGATDATVINCTPPSAYSLSDSLSKRCIAANNSGCDIFISIHHNAGGGTGAEVLIYPEDSSINLGKVILNKLEKIGLRNRGVKGREDLYVLKGTKMPALIVECAFVDNPNDMSSYNYSAVANALFEGIYSVYNLTVKNLGGSDNHSETSNAGGSSNLDSTSGASSSGNQGGTSSSGNLNNNSGTSIYTVVKGETLYGISRRFNTTVAKIASKNGIENVNLIYPGQKLIIE